MALPLRHSSLQRTFKVHSGIRQVRLKGSELKVLAGRAAKRKEESRAFKAHENGSGVQSSPSSSSTQVSDQAEASNGEATGQENPLLPDDPVGSLSEFGVPSTSDRPDEQATNIVEQISTGPSAATYAIWITVLLSAIGVFYGLVFAASGGLSNFLKDKVTFTRKDFVPYSERRRLEDELMASKQGPQGAERSGEEPQSGPSQPRSQQTPQGLYNLMPAPPLKK